MTDDERAALVLTIEAGKTLPEAAGLAYLAELALAEVDRLKSVIERNKSGYLALQALAAEQRAELEGIKRKKAAHDLVEELKRRGEEKRKHNEEVFAEAFYDELTKLRASKGEN